METGICRSSTGFPHIRSWLACRIEHSARVGPWKCFRSSLMGALRSCSFPIAPDSRPASARGRVWQRIPLCAVAPNRSQRGARASRGVDPLVLVLVLLLLLVSASRATAWWRLVAASLLLGLLGYFRSEWLLFVPFAGLAFLAACRRRAVLVAVASMCLASLLILSPWLARTYALTGSMFLSASTGP